MRKKLFAALALQLAAAVLILCFSELWPALAEKYGKDFSFPVTVDDCYYEIDTDKAEITGYFIRFFADAEATPPFDGAKRRAYKDISGQTGSVGISVYDANYYSDDTPLFHMDLWGRYALRNRSTGEALYLYISNRVSLAYPCFPPQFYKNNEVRANLRIFRDRVKLVSVTVNGVDFGEYFSDPAHFDFE